MIGLQVDEIQFKGELKEIFDEKLELFISNAKEGL